MNIAGYTLLYFEQDFLIELLYWMGYNFIPTSSAALLGCHSFFHGIFLIQVYF
jgi:hypothetical protein